MSLNSPKFEVDSQRMGALGRMGTCKERLVPLGEMACDLIEIYLREARPKLAGSDQPLLKSTSPRPSPNDDNLNSGFTGRGDGA